MKELTMLLPLLLMVTGCGHNIPEQTELVVRPTATEPRVEIVETVDLTPITTYIQLYVPSEEDVAYLAKTMWGEAKGVPSDMEKAAVAWCVLNRVDSQEYPNTIGEVVSQPNQFLGYNPNYPVTDEFAEIAKDVLIRWNNEKINGTLDGRVLPQEYLYFGGDGEHNYFRKQLQLNGEYWDWSLPNPYEN